MTIPNRAPRRAGAVAAFVSAAALFAVATVVRAEAPSCADPELTTSACAMFAGCVRGGPRFEGRALGLGRGEAEALLSSGAVCEAEWAWRGPGRGDATGVCREADQPERRFEATLEMIDPQSGLVRAEGRIEGAPFRAELRVGAPGDVVAPEAPCGPLTPIS